MANHPIVPPDIAARYEVHEWRNGLAILAAAHAEEWANIVEVLRGFTLLKSDVLKPGSSKGLISSKLDSHFTKLGWAEKKFDTKIVDTAEHIAPTHKVDCYKNRIALEVEWNNKDPFYDRRSEQFSSAFRSPRNRCRRDHHPVYGIAADLQQARQRPQLWQLDNPYGKTTSAA